ncbi:Gfo/Idh/MocA family protein [Fodinicurvata halophila]|uniref:Gfo/Idh/MocA family protein n=2 Tax=Fodinicurvata halophila TaxID=1419723 RepID=A0ABV8UNI9_9PROT
MAERVRLGMVGGGADAFIGAVHRIAARLDGHYELVAGALSSTPDKARASGEAVGLPRIYDTYAEMAKREARRKDGIEAVAVVTPNHLHYAVAREFLKRDIDVICDKPLTGTLPEARRLARLAERSKALFILTHNYTGYPMIRQAREMVADGELGRLRLVNVEYPQDWLTEPVEQQGVKQAEWRTDPDRSGTGGAIGDIGTHAFNLAQFVTRLELDRLSADLDSFAPGRRLDDNAHVMLRFESGVKGLLWCSQVAPGVENGLRLRIFGDRGGLEWFQEEPGRLWVTRHGEPKRLYTRNGAGATPGNTASSRIPPGHPEGYLEAFANLYAEAAEAIRARREGRPAPANLLPSVNDGLRGVAFVDACVRSSARDAAWVRPR